MASVSAHPPQMALDSSIYKALVQVAVAQGWAIGPSDIDQEQSSQTDVSVIARRNDGSVLKRIALDEVRAKLGPAQPIATAPPPPPPPVASKVSGQTKSEDMGNHWAPGLLLISALILILSGIGDISVQSKGAESWEEETSFAALTLRSLGTLKLGIGIAILGASNLRIRP